LETVRREFEPQGIRFLALSLDADEESVRAAAKKIGIQMTVALADGELLGPLGVNKVPSTVFVNSSGFVVAAASGERNRKFFYSRAKELLQ
jgi:hypothetical protein